MDYTYKIPLFDWMFLGGYQEKVIMGGLAKAMVYYRYDAHRIWEVV